MFCVGQVPARRWRARPPGIFLSGMPPWEGIPVSESYNRARKLGLKQFHRDEVAGAFPYPPALDDLLEGQGRLPRVHVGTVELDPALVVGTKTRARQNIFASNFLPIAPEGSEFATKWSALCESQLEEGTREPIEVFEYLQRFYVQEGNKRVSVARYLGSPTLPAKVVRVMPAETDSPQAKAYLEFTRFYSVARIYGIVLTHEGGYARLAELFGEDLEHRWPDEKRDALRRLFSRFSKAYGEHADDVGLTAGDALLVALSVCGLDELSRQRPAQLAETVERLRGEFAALSGQASVAYLEDPDATPDEPGVMEKLVSSLRSFYSVYQSAVEGPTKVAFVYDQSPMTSRWVAAHEEGRHDLERRLGDQVETFAYPSAYEDDDFDAVVADAVERGASLVVTVSPTQMAQTLRAAVKYPDVEFINCSVSLSHDAVRIFSGRLYEAKFLLGALAAAISKDHRIGYVAESPVYNSVAEVNAFARGAEMVDAHALVYLEWVEEAGNDPREAFAKQGIKVVSGHDFPDPLHPEEPWGLWYDAGDGLDIQLGAPVWNWGLYYERLVQSLRNDTWRAEGERLPAQTLNYWWGLSSGVVDVHVDEDVPEPQRRLVELLRQGVVSGTVDPFSGELLSQERPIQPEGSPRLPSEAIARMDWLAHNVAGHVPPTELLTEGARRAVEVNGVAESVLGETDEGGDPA